MLLQDCPVVLGSRANHGDLPVTGRSRPARVRHAQADKANGSHERFLCKRIYSAPRGGWMLAQSCYDLGVPSGIAANRRPELCPQQLKLAGYFLPEQGFVVAHFVLMNVP